MRYRLSVEDGEYGSLRNQTALVTGGSRGIGQAVCLRFAEAGADVVVNYAGNEAAAEETAELCRAYGVQAICVQADVSDSEACERLFREACAFAQRLKQEAEQMAKDREPSDSVIQESGRGRSGGLEIVVCNAGVTRDGLLMRMQEEDFLRVQQVNLLGTFHCMKQASRVMLRQRYGRIISISSIVGLDGNAGQVNYAASKAGVIGMTKSLAREVASRNITVNAVAPGWIDTEMSAAVDEKVREAFLGRIPRGRPGRPEEVAHAVYFFAQPESAYMTGQVLRVDGGM